MTIAGNMRRGKPKKTWEMVEADNEKEKFDNQGYSLQSKMEELLQEPG